jgi:hypothetical protein
MDNTHAELLSAFFDGERVDAELLAESLVQPGASELLAEFAAMRAQVQGDTCRPSPEFFETMARKLRGSTLQRLFGGHLLKVALVATLVVAVGVAGFLLGAGRARPGITARDQAATATRPTTAGREIPASPAPTIPPPAAAAEKPASVRPPVEPAGPPVPSLRMRPNQWREHSVAAAEDGGRH